MVSCVVFCSFLAFVVFFCLVLWVVFHVGLLCFCAVPGVLGSAGLHVFLNVVVLNSFSHVFESDAVVKPLCPLANLLGGCFCLGSGPSCVSGLLFLLTKRKSGWRFAGRLAGLCVVWFVVICLHFRTFWSLYKLTFTAYAHVRTEPQCDIGHTRGKKNAVPGVSLLR